MDELIQIISSAMAEVDEATISESIRAQQGGSDEFQSSSRFRDASESTRQAIAHRRRIRTDPDVVAVLDCFWDSMDLRTGAITFKQYAGIEAKLCKATDANFMYADFHSRLRSEWKRAGPSKRGPGGSVTKDYFCERVFETADLLCPTVNALGYVKFLESLLEHVTTPGGLYRRLNDISHNADLEQGSAEHVSATSQARRTVESRLDILTIKWAVASMWLNLMRRCEPQCPEQIELLRETMGFGEVKDERVSAVHEGRPKLWQKVSRFLCIMGSFQRVYTDALVQRLKYRVESKTKEQTTPGPQVQAKPLSARERRLPRQQQGRSMARRAAAALGRALRAPLSARTPRGAVGLAGAEDDAPVPRLQEDLGSIAARAPGAGRGPLPPALELPIGGVVDTPRRGSARLESLPEGLERARPNSPTLRLRPKPQSSRRPTSSRSAQKSTGRKLPLSARPRLGDIAQSPTAGVEDAMASVADSLLGVQHDRGARPPRDASSPKLQSFSSGRAAASSNTLMRVTQVVPTPRAPPMSGESAPGSSRSRSLSRGESPRRLTPRVDMGFVPAPLASPPPLTTGIGSDGTRALSPIPASPPTAAGGRYSLYDMGGSMGSLFDQDGDAAPRTARGVGPGGGRVTGRIARDLHGRILGPEPRRLAVSVVSPFLKSNDQINDRNPFTGKQAKGTPAVVRGSRRNGQSRVTGSRRGGAARASERLREIRQRHALSQRKKPPGGIDKLWATAPTLRLGGQRSRGTRKSGTATARAKPRQVWAAPRDASTYPASARVAVNLEHHPRVRRFMGLARSKEPKRVSLDTKIKRNTRARLREKREASTRARALDNLPQELSAGRLKLTHRVKGFNVRIPL